MMKKILLITFFLLSSYMMFAQVKMSFPYELVGGKMCIKVYINNEYHTVILDTGGKTTITKELQERLNLPLIDSLQITDAASEVRTYHRYKIDQLLFQNKEMKIVEIPALVLDRGSQVFSYFNNAVGIIGNDVISNFIMEIDSRNKVVNLLPPDHKIQISLRNMVKFESNQGNMPIFNLGLEYGKALKVLFDTGAGPFLSIKPSDYEGLRESGAIILEAEGDSKGMMGIAGVTNITKEYRINLPLVTAGAYKFKEVSASVQNVPVSLLGTSMLKYGKVTIDYPRSRFYFEPYTKEPTMLATKFWDVGLTVTDGALCISSLWGDKRSEASIGDQVTEIDGEKVPKLDFQDTLINGLIMLKGKEEATLTVNHKGELKKVVMTRK